MKNLKSTAGRKLLKKLSALRATLSNDEREILDGMIGAEEVSAHKLNFQKTAIKQSKTAQVKTQEVNAHQMTPRKTSIKTAAKKAQKNFRIQFDLNSEEYKIQD